MPNILIKPYHESNMHDVLCLIEQSGFTTRDSETWTANNMSAVLAYDSDKLIGAIPFERFNICLSKNSSTAALWVSAAYVDPDYRSKGIGSLLDEAIKKYFYPEYTIVMVVRKDEGTAAFRWYKKIGYNVVSKIESMRLEVSHNKNNTNYKIFESSNSIEKISNHLVECFDRHNYSHLGYPLRNSSFWLNKFKYHYYKQSYIYSVLARIIDNKIISYSLLGRTSMNDGVDRLDLLEFVCSDEKHEQDDTYDAVMHYAHSIGVSELRIQSLEGDYLLKHALNYGFEKRWETNLMAKMLNQNDNLPKGNWRFFHVDYL